MRWFPRIRLVISFREKHCELCSEPSGDFRLCRDCYLVKTAHAQLKGEWEVTGRGLTSRREGLGETDPTAVLLTIPLFRPILDAEERLRRAVSAPRTTPS